MGRSFVKNTFHGRKIHVLWKLSELVSSNFNGNSFEDKLNKKFYGSAITKQLYTTRSKLGHQWNPKLKRRPQFRII